jgi:hypothetical protein
MRREAHQHPRTFLEALEDTYSIFSKAKQVYQQNNPINTSDDEVIKLIASALHLIFQEDIALVDAAVCECKLQAKYPNLTNPSPHKPLYGSSNEPIKGHSKYDDDDVKLQHIYSNHSYTSPKSLKEQSKGHSKDDDDDSDEDIFTLPQYSHSVQKLEVKQHDNETKTETKSSPSPNKVKSKKESPEKTSQGYKSPNKTTQHHKPHHVENNVCIYGRHCSKLDDAAHRKAMKHPCKSKTYCRSVPLFYV